MVGDCAEPPITREDLFLDLFEKYTPPAALCGRMEGSYRGAYRSPLPGYVMTPIEVHQDIHKDVLAHTVLDAALDAERRQHGSFWAEALHTLVFGYEGCTPLEKEEAFDYFIYFMLAFNDVYGSVLPPEFSDMTELRYLCNVYEGLRQVTPTLLWKMNTLTIALLAMNPEDGWVSAGCPSSPRSWTSLIDRLSVDPF